MKKLDPNTPLSVILWLIAAFMILMAVCCVGGTIYGIASGR